MDTTLQQYTAFISVAECGSISRAAKKLYYSPSGVSRMLTQLERSLGISLFMRSKDTLQLTPEGHNILPYAKAIVQENEKLQREIDNITRPKSNTIRIGSISGVAIQWLPDIIKAFRCEHSGIDFELKLGECTDIEDWICSDRVDCGILLLPTRSDLETIPLGRDRLCAILPQSHPLCRQNKISLFELHQEPFILNRGVQKEITQLFLREGLTPHFHFTTWNDCNVLSMVESGFGVSIMPHMILNQTAYRIAAKEINTSADWRIGLAVKSKAQTSPAVNRFIDYLQLRIKEQ